MTVVVGALGALLLGVLCVLADRWVQSPQRPAAVRPVKAPRRPKPARKAAAPAPAPTPAPRAASTEVAVAEPAPVAVLAAAMPAPERRPARGAHRPVKVRRSLAGWLRGRRSPLPPMSVRCDLCRRPWVGHDTAQCLRGAAMGHACPACGAPAGTACPTGWAGHQRRVDLVQAGHRWHWMYSAGGGVTEPCFCGAGRDHDEAGRAA